MGGQEESDSSKSKGVDMIYCPQESEEITIGWVTRLLGAGSFGHVYKIELIENGEVRALKVESRGSLSKSQLRMEQSVYEATHAEKGFPRCYRAFFGDIVRVIEVDYMGPSVHDFQSKATRFSEKTVLMVGYQVLNAIESLILSEIKRKPQTKSA